MRLRLRHGLAAVAATVFLASLIAPAAAGADPSGLDWRPCTGHAQRGFQCASMRVPLRYSKPHARRIQLALIRQPALDGHAEKGSLVVNFGGPGGSGLQTLPSYVGGLSKRDRDAFDLVSFDPRGVGASDPIECHRPTAGSSPLTRTAIRRRPRSSTAFATSAESAWRTPVAASCRIWARERWCATSTGPCRRRREGLSYVGSPMARGSARSTPTASRSGFARSCSTGRWIPGPTSTPLVSIRRRRGRTC